MASKDQVARLIFDLAKSQVVSTNPEEPAAPAFVGVAGNALVISVRPQQTILGQLCTFKIQIYLLKRTRPENEKKTFRLQTSGAQLSIGKGQLICDTSKEIRKTSLSWPGDAMQL